MVLLSEVSIYLSIYQSFGCLDYYVLTKKTHIIDCVFRAILRDMKTKLYFFYFETSFVHKDEIYRPYTAIFFLEFFKNVSVREALIAIYYMF